MSIVTYYPPENRDFALARQPIPLRDHDIDAIDDLCPGVWAAILGAYQAGYDDNATSGEHADAVSSLGYQQRRLSKLLDSLRKVVTGPWRDDIADDVHAVLAPPLASILDNIDTLDDCAGEIATQIAALETF